MFYHRTEDMVKMYNTLGSVPRRPQRSSGIALRIMPPDLVKTLRVAILPDERNAGPAAVTNLGATAVEVVNPRTCRHESLEAYGGAAGRFRTCTRCRKRWKEAARRDGTKGWKEYGFKRSDKDKTDEDRACDLGLGSVGSSRSAQPSQGSTRAPPPPERCPTCGAGLTTMEGDLGKMSLCRNFPRCQWSRQAAPTTTAPSAPAPAQMPVSPEFDGPTGNDAVTERMRLHEERVEARAQAEALAAQARQKSFNEEMAQAIQASLQDQMRRSMETVRETLSQEVAQGRTSTVEPSPKRKGRPGRASASTSMPAPMTLDGAHPVPAEPAAAMALPAVDMTLSPANLAQLDGLGQPGPATYQDVSSTISGATSFIKIGDDAEQEDMSADSSVLEEA